MEHKLIVDHVAVEIKNGQLTLVKIPGVSYQTLDEMGEFLKKNIDLYIAHIKKECVGHNTSHAILAHPLMHVIFDDMSMGNPEYLNRIQQERN